MKILEKKEIVSKVVTLYCFEGYDFYWVYRPAVIENPLPVRAQFKFAYEEIVLDEVVIPRRSIFAYAGYKSFEEFFDLYSGAIGVLYHEVGHDYSRDEAKAWEIGYEVAPEDLQPIVARERERVEAVGWDFV